MIKTILVPIDGSSHSKKATDLAADIAAQYDARLVILHILMRHSSRTDVEAMCRENAMPDALAKKFNDLNKVGLEMEVAAYEPGPIFMHVPDGILAEVAELVVKNAQLLAQSKGLKDINTLIVDGSPADMIVAVADKENADMIVMGSRGLGNIASALMGSVSHKVSHLSKCTCVTVK